jgi:hypothetical protein
VGQIVLYKPLEKFYFVINSSHYGTISNEIPTTLDSDWTLQHCIPEVAPKMYRYGFWTRQIILRPFVSTIDKIYSPGTVVSSHQIKQRYGARLGKLF